MAPRPRTPERRRPQVHPAHPLADAGPTVQRYRGLAQRRADEERSRDWLRAVSLRGQGLMAVSILPERPDSDDARGLIEELEGHLAQHYAAESRHGYSVDK